MIYHNQKFIIANFQEMHYLKNHNYLRMSIDRGNYGSMSRPFLVRIPYFLFLFHLIYCKSGLKGIT